MISDTYLLNGGKLSSISLVEYVLDEPLLYDQIYRTLFFEENEILIFRQNLIVIWAQPDQSFN